MMFRRLVVLLSMTLAALSAGSAEAESPAALATAAKAFLATLAPEQLASARFGFDAEERFNWYFVPRPRAGLPLKRMTPPQREAALALLRVGLSEKGYTKAEAVRALEPVLAELEKDPTRRDPELYYLTIFGEPTDTGTWGWRWEGHHISQNWTIVAGKAVATSPQFFGANPAEVRQGPKQGTRVLKGEEDLARALLEALTDGQRTEAIASAEAPDDILTTNARKAAIQENKGLAWKAMTEQQRGLLLTLIDEYAGNLPKRLAQARVDRLRQAGLDEVRFAWMGGTKRGERHYYRVQGPTFLIEYDNTQNNANHIHTVWRDFNGDWGTDLLAEHYKNSAHHQRAVDDRVNAKR
jgi:hypothetical protein